MYLTLPEDTDSVLMDGGGFLIFDNSVTVMSRESLICLSDNHWRVWSDASWNQEVGIAGAGAWIADPHGVHIASLSTASKDGTLTESFGAEIFAFSEGARMASDLGVRKIRFRFDCMPLARRIVRALSESSPSCHENAVVRKVLEPFDSIILEWTPRERNKLADRLSRMRIPDDRTACRIRSLFDEDFYDDPVRFADSPFHERDLEPRRFERLTSKQQRNGVLVTYRLAENGKSIWATASPLHPCPNRIFRIARASRRFLSNKAIHGKNLDNVIVDACREACMKLMDNMKNRKPGFMIFVGDPPFQSSEIFTRVFGGECHLYSVERDDFLEITRISDFIISKTGIAIALEAKRRSANARGIVLGHGFI